MVAIDGTKYFIKLWEGKQLLKIIKYLQLMARYKGLAKFQSLSVLKKLYILMHYVYLNC